MQVQYGSVAMIQPWMALVEEIHGNFPGLETPQALEEHRQTVLRFMEKRQALFVRDGGRVAGVLLFSRGRNMICCLGVAPAYRRRGIASLLLGEALAQLDRTRAVTVSTFREQDPKGAAPRALYRKFGFREGPNRYWLPSRLRLSARLKWRPRLRPRWKPRLPVRLLPRKPAIP